MSYGFDTERTPEEVNSSGKDYFTLYTVFARNVSGAQAGSQTGGQVRAQTEAPASASRDEEVTAEFEDTILDLKDDEVTLRGVYDVSAMRADADVLTWTYAHSADALQAAVRRIRRTGMLAQTRIVFSAMAVHRTAEFNRGHVPAFALGAPAQDWLAVYPFNRSYDWYLMDPAKRGEMLREHGKLGQEFPSVLANTASAFALNDWEWMLALESNHLTDLVDMMRRLRESETRYHVRDETPFYTGRRLMTTAEIAEVLA